jgi:hypothetical protein
VTGPKFSKPAQPFASAAWRYNVWPLRIATLILLLATINYVLALAIRLNGPSRDGVTFYWPIIYAENVFWLSCGLVPMFILVIAHLLPRPTAVSFAAIVVCAGLITFAQYNFLSFDGYTDVQRANLDEQVYHVGSRSESYGYSTLVLCECDRWGFSCRCHDFFHGWSVGPPGLTVDPVAHSVNVQADGNLIYSFGAHPHCYSEDKYLAGSCLDDR